MRFPRLRQPSLQLPVGLYCRSAVRCPDAGAPPIDPLTDVDVKAASSTQLPSTSGALRPDAVGGMAFFFPRWDHIPWRRSPPLVMMAACRRLHTVTLAAGRWHIAAFAAPVKRAGLFPQARGLVHEVLANGDIPFPRVRVIDDVGLVGDFNVGEARSLARQRGTDLVLMSGAVVPPLCRLVNLTDYIAEQDRKAAADETQRQERLKREFSFDPAMKVKGMRFLPTIDEHDLERKVNQIRRFLEKGHRVEARISQGRSPPDDVLDLGLRICAELRDLAKPENLEESVREFRAAVHAPKSRKLRGRSVDSIEILRLRLWPCTPAQGNAFVVPAHIIGPRRRRGPAIVGIDDGEEPEDAWKLKRKPKARIPEGYTKHNLRKDFESDT